MVRLAAGDSRANARLCSRSWGPRQTDLPYCRSVNGNTHHRHRHGAVINGLILPAGADTPVPGNVSWSDGIIDHVGPDAPPPNRQVVDAAGALVLPGIIDVHGDAFERCLMPRSGVPIDVGIALADNDAQLLAAGITTSYLSATDSWEPGLRSRQMLRELVTGLSKRRGGPEVLLHVRHERCATEGIDELLEWIESGAVHLLSYNDHTLGPGRVGGKTYAPAEDGLAPVGATQVQRCGIEPAVLRQLQADAAGRREIGAEQEVKLASVAQRVGCVTASHDADSPDHIERDRSLGVAIAEFPLTIELADRYRTDGIPVLFGAPNLVRGGSHLGNLSVADALRAGVGDLLCSDYHYPSLLQAPFVAADGLRTFGKAWDLVSAGPADAIGLRDRGRLAVGARADVVVVDPPVECGPAVVTHAFVSGTHSLAAASPIGST